MLTSDYLKFQEEYSDKYGEKTIVLMQIGSFYETFEYDPKRDKSSSLEAEDIHCFKKDGIGSEINKKIGLVHEIAALLNICPTMKNNKKPYGINNCSMCGFPVVSYEKHRDLLLANNYTIVRIDQKKNGDNVERFVAEILSPATNIDNLQSLPLTNNIVSIYIEVMKENFHYED